MTLLGTPWSGKLDLSDPASGPLLESWLLAIQGIIDGNIDFNNVNALGNLPLTALATGVWEHNAGSSVKRKIMRGKKSVATAAATTATATITFATDTDDPTGATAFKAATVPVVTMTAVGAVATICMLTAAPSNTAATIKLWGTDGAAAVALPDPIVIHWEAVGENT